MKAKCCFFMLILLCGTPLFGWWDLGHMVVAKIAYDRLKPHIKEKVDHLISLIPEMAQRSSFFISAACWADDITKEGLQAFRSWHASPLPYDPEGLLSPDKRDTMLALLKNRDIVFALQECVKTLKNPQASDWAKALMLRFLIHLIGDIHQPFTCISLYNREFPEGDRSGKDFIIEWGHQKNSLHSYWDAICGLGVNHVERPLSGQGLKQIDEIAKAVIFYFPEEQFQMDQKINFSSWQQEAYEVGEKIAYMGIKPYQKVPPDYERKGQEAAAICVAKAGYRLAYLLNALL
ncbi:MAG: S1/P1 nuclease [Chlamydiia bacterium]|nr:S1/P1 nuclease [Chlamydiia bacterium]